MAQITIIILKQFQSVPFSIYFLMSFLTYPGTDGKTINIEVDSEDLLKIVKNLINSDVVKKFAEHVYRRSIGLSKTYNNPFHPEDELTSFFDETFLRNIVNYHPKTISNNDEKKAVGDLDKENQGSVDNNVRVNISTDNKKLKRTFVKRNTSVTKINP